MEMKIIQGRNSLIKNVTNGDLIPVGGSLFSDELSMYLKNDSENLSHIFASYENVMNQFDIAQTRETMQNYLNHQKIDCPLEVFLAGYAFALVMQSKHPDFSVNVSQRGAKYADNDAVALSELLNNKSAACSEISLLALQCFESANIDSAMLVGSVLDDTNIEYADEHTFLLTHHDNSHFVFDTVNFIKYSNGKWAPHIYRLSSEQYQAFEQSFDHKENCLMEARSVMMPEKTRYFGYGHATNIIPSQLLPLADFPPPKDHGLKAAL